MQAWIKRNTRNSVRVVYMSEINNDYRAIPDAKIYGIYLVTPNFPEAKKIYAYLKSERQDSLVLAGGPHPSALPGTCKGKVCDYPVVGSGEEVLKKVVQCGDLEYINFILSKSFEEDNCVDVDTYSDVELDYSDTDPSRYASWLLVTDVGCYYSCRFCFKLSRSVSRFPEKFVRRCISDCSSFGAKKIKFTSDNVLVDFLKNEYVFEELQRKGLEYEACGRLDNVTSYKAELLKHTGCSMLKAGVESGSQRVLDLMGKREKLSDMLRGASMLRAAGLSFGAYLIANYPGETDEDRKMTVDFVRKLSPDWFSLYNFTPYPGTYAWKELLTNEQRRNIIDSDFEGMRHAGLPEDADEIVKQMTQEMRS